MKVESGLLDMEMDEVKITIQKEDDGKTIKEFLKSNHVGRGKIEEIRVKKSSLINGVYHCIDDKISENDQLSFLIDEEPDFLPENLPLNIVYEDDYLLIINKPAGMIIYPDEKTKKGTIVNLVSNYYRKRNIHRKVRYLHRLDKETTGILLFAKDFFTEAILLKDIENHTLQRFYLALVEGHFSCDKGTIEESIAQDRHVNGKMCVYKNGKSALTMYKVIQNFPSYSLIEFQLKTGRTHQIRLHSSYMNHPLLGDVLYGGNMQYISRTALHSYKVEMIHPIRKEKLVIQIDLANDMKKLLK